jgi:segregation and condensation protein B
MLCGYNSPMSIPADPYSDQAEPTAFEASITVLKGRIEAALFLTSRPLAVRDLADTLGAFSTDIETALMELLHDYACRGDDCALEIDDGDAGYILQVKSHYRPLVEQMIPMELSQAATRTLSAIALKAPISQKDLIDWRGSGAYEHIQELVKHKLISKKRQGRSYIIDVTPTFKHYFKVEQSLSSLQLQALLVEKEADTATAEDING